MGTDPTIAMWYMAVSGFLYSANGGLHVNNSTTVQPKDQMSATNKETNQKKRKKKEVTKEIKRPKQREQIKIDVKKTCINIKKCNLVAGQHQTKPNHVQRTNQTLQIKQRQPTQPPHPTSHSPACCQSWHVWHSPLITSGDIQFGVPFSPELLLCLVAALWWVSLVSFALPPPLNDKIDWPVTVPLF